MTALDRYLRLEAVGLWREAPDADVREVIVSFGKTTLLFTDLRERPLGHWPLGGIRILDGTDASGSTVYAMSDGETLAVRDPDMVAAIAAVCRAQPALRVQARRRRRRRRRNLAGIAAVIALILLVLIVPAYVRNRTLHSITPAEEAQIGARMLASLASTRGPACTDPAGTRALLKLQHDVEPQAHPEVHVMQLGHTGAVMLPGNILLIDGTSLRTETEDYIRGWLHDPESGDETRRFVHDAGVLADLRYLATGRFDDAAVARAAESALTHLRYTGLRGGAYDFTDEDWQALRAICQP